MAQDTEQCTKFQRGSTGQKGHNNKFSHDSEACVLNSGLEMSAKNRLQFSTNLEYELSLTITMQIWKLLKLKISSNPNA